MLSDPYKLQRFLDAQAGCYAEVLAELRAGQKYTHWMWFIFPQIDGLGASSTTRHYAIKSLDEARAYLLHPVLGARLFECTASVNALQGRTALEIFREPDASKFRSSMSLFALVTDPSSPFADALQKYCAGHDDGRTRQLAGAT